SLGLLKRTKNSRIVNVSSAGAKFFKNFDPKQVDSYPGFLAVYAKSKLCNILFTIELAQKLKGTDVTTYSLHPGAVKTDVFRDVTGWWKIAFIVVSNLFYKVSINIFFIKNTYSCFLL